MLLPLLYLLLLLNSWWLDGFLSQRFLHLKWMMIKMIRSVMGKKQMTTLIHVIRSRMKVEQGKSCSKADWFKQKWNGPVSCAHTLGPVPLRRRWRGWGGGGAYSIWCDSECCFACWSTPEAILFSWSFHLFLDPGDRAPPASHTKCSVSAGMWYQWLLFFTTTRGTSTSKNQHCMPV